ncbi:MAG: arsenate reductase (glutaredoxin) [Winogradskyella sp.]|uniref:arsenate reductase (glutaredoxin) n=1 Tax=Winogradskyella sp. TaxID=1883156 RepID=UPI0017C1405D|nr:arsenate reductase (glutaredoxin) [Winogradskyella sp.]MBT8244839.1 arsenate reductase (glutaredoxin) [Winogradskyella sp.]NNK21797.1 arsenate reductase (glutaredoxin) [Winogradskyella sp.]
MIQILHNPRCKKSREGLQFLEDNNVDFEIIKYLDNKLSESELDVIITKLKIAPIALVRKNEAIWKSDYKGKELSNSEIIKAMIAHPKLIERPIIINKNKAVVGRPTETIKTIL